MGGLATPPLVGPFTIVMEVKREDVKVSFVQRGGEKRWIVYA